MARWIERFVRRLERFRTPIQDALSLTIASSIALTTTIICSAPFASAYQASPGAPFANGTIFYTVDPSFTTAGFLVPSLWAAEQGWKINGLTANFQFWNTNDHMGSENRRVVAAFIDGAGGAAANASVGCNNNDSTCIMRFEANNGPPPWNTTTEHRSNAWIDFVGVATHEFGHWVGLNHSTDFVGSDGSKRPTMDAAWNSENDGGFYYRSIQADDENGLRAVRPTAIGNIVANPSFEHRPVDADGAYAWGGFNNRGWTFRKASGAAPAAIYSSGTGQEGTFWIEFNNGGGAAGSSFYQDIFVRGDPAGATITPRIRLRDPGDAGVTGTIVVWQITPGPPTPVAQLNVAPTANWADVTLPTFNAVTNRLYRIEVYNNHATLNLDIDNGRLNF